MSKRAYLLKLNKKQSIIHSLAENHICSALCGPQKYERNPYVMSLS